MAGVRIFVVVVLVRWIQLTSGTVTNVALMKHAWMSSTIDQSHKATKAVDGDTRANNYSHVAHTMAWQPTSWWKVDLQTQVQSARVILYFRTDYITRRNGVLLYTSGTNSSNPKEGNLCHSVTGKPDGTDIPNVLNVTCPGTWRYLTVFTETNNDENGAILDFAEVQVWNSDTTTQAHKMSFDICGYRSYMITRRNGVLLYTSGTNSSDPQNGNLCHTVIGRPSGTGIPDVLNVTCPGTWRYLTVYTDTNNDGGSAILYFAEVQVWMCSAGMYGVNCGKNCNYRHCVGPSLSCDPSTGACSSGQCQAGWTGTDCAVCVDGKYGPGCARNCSSRHCKVSSSACPHISGYCPNGGCEDGWMGDDCSTECPSGKYGTICNRTCGHCANNNTCHHVTGICAGGCETGWQADLCKEVCRSGTYGTNCNRGCGRCANNDTCHHVTGICAGGCEAGWQGDLCQKECPSERYGPNCNNTCGYCANNNRCHHVTGVCADGCEAGWQGDLCEEAFRSGPAESDFPVAAVTGTVAGLLVVVIVIVVVVVLVRRRRQQFHDSEIKTQDAEFCPKAHGRTGHENGIYEDVALDESAAVNQKPAIKPKPATQTTSGKKDDSKDQEEEDVEEEVQSADNCYYNTGADDVVRDVAVSELAATVATLKERKDGFEKEYRRLPTGFTAPYQDSQKPENSGKNKFRGYYPYDHNRVRLTPLPDVAGSDYINASFMHSYNQGKTYIASQAPNKKTVGDFWRMIWEHSCSHVVMLTGLTEECRVKCERYWPADGVLETGGLKIDVEVTQNRANFTTRHLKVTSNSTGECRSVIQFHFTSWPDHGVPDTIALVNYIWLVRRAVAETDGPLLVHCSAGIGRTGTYIAVDSLIDQARGEGVVDVLGYVSAMRGLRKNMVQTPAQYECVFLCLLEMTTYGNTSMDVSNYTNSYSSSGMDTTVDGKTFSQLSEMLVSDARGDPPDRHRMWVDGNPDFIVRVGPSLTCLKGYLQANAPPPGLVKLLWKLVEENNVHNIIVVSPNMGLVQAEGRSTTHGEITVTTTSETSLSTDLTMNKLQLETKTARPRQVKMIRVDAHLTMEVMTSYLLNHAQLQEISTQPHPVVVLHSENDRKLAVSFCIMGNILSGIREDTRVDVIGHVRTFLRCCPDLQINESDVQMFHEFAQQCILRTDPSNTYANI